MVDMSDNIEVAPTSLVAVPRLGTMLMVLVEFKDSHCSPCVLSSSFVR